MFTSEQVITKWLLPAVPEDTYIGMARAKSEWSANYGSLELAVDRNRNYRTGLPRLDESTSPGQLHTAFYMFEITNKYPGRPTTFQG